MIDLLLKILVITEYFMCWVDCLHFFNRATNLEGLSEFASQEFK